MSPHLSLTRRRRYCPRLEALESRETPAALQPTPLEQLFLERVNDIRANPAAFGFAAPAVQPFAFDPRIKVVAAAHTEAAFLAKRLLRANGVRIRPGNSIYDRYTGWPGQPQALAASLETWVVQLARPWEAQSALLNLWPPGSARLRPHRLIGIQFDLVPMRGDQSYMMYVDFITLAPADPRPILTGSVFRDSNHNGKYDVGEGLAGVKLRVAGQKGVVDFASGGYTLPVARAGTVRVTASGGSLPAPITQTVRVPAGKNARLNFIVP
jgi:hypothetical protein